MVVWHVKLGRVILGNFPLSLRNSAQPSDWLSGRRLVGSLCLTSHRQRGHLETAPPFTVPCKGRQACFYTVPTGNRTPAVGSKKATMAHFIHFNHRLQIPRFLYNQATGGRIDENRWLPDQNADLRWREQHHGGSFQYGACRRHLCSVPLRFQVLRRNTERTCENDIQSYLAKFYLA